MNIILGVCGSISAYKAHDISRLLIKAGHAVKIVLTRGASEFVSAKTCAWPGTLDVFSADDDFKRSTGKRIEHIELARWADLLLISPLSANTLASLAHAQANDLLTCLFLALDKNKPVALFPAMNTKMLVHPLVQENIQRISQLPCHYVHPGEIGELACGEFGEGKLPSPQSVVDFTLSLPQHSPEQKKTYLITTGATISALDPVRYLTNGSTGITGFSIAQMVLARGHQAIVIAGKTATLQLDHLIPNQNFKLLHVLTTKEMAEAVKQNMQNFDIYVSAAAIADFEFDMTATDKIKKDSMSGLLKIKTAPDILAYVLDNKKPNQKVVGFAAETQLTTEMLEEKFLRKPVDMLVGTKVHTGLSTDDKNREGFGNPQAMYMIKRPGLPMLNASMSKQELSQLIVDGELTCN
jgi:phosphopantothenoylcysteine decarboxylase/phosphopantothenate--cysteine ligase